MSSTACTATPTATGSRTPPTSTCFRSVLGATTTDVTFDINGEMAMRPTSTLCQPRLGSQSVSITGRLPYHNDVRQRQAHSTLYTVSPWRPRGPTTSSSNASGGAHRQWHRMFGLLLADYLVDSPFTVEVEKDLSMRTSGSTWWSSPTSGPVPRPLPDGLDDFVAHNLISFKSFREPLDDWLKELTGHYVNYRKQVSPKPRLLPETDSGCTPSAAALRDLFRRSRSHRSRRAFISSVGAPMPSASSWSATCRRRANALLHLSRGPGSGRIRRDAPWNAKIAQNQLDRRPTLPSSTEWRCLRWPTPGKITCTTTTTAS